MARAIAAWPLLAALAAAEARASTAPLPAPGDAENSDAGACALRLEGLDDDGHAAMTTVASATPSAGLVIAPLHAAAGGSGRWRRLTLSPDPPGAGGSGAIPVEEIAWADGARDLIGMRAAGIAPCPAPSFGSEERTNVETAAPGETLVGFRERAGYRPRRFDAVIERLVRVPGGPDLLLLRLADGGGAASGFLFDRHDRLVGSILQAPAGGDRGLACAVRLDAAGLAGDLAGDEPAALLRRAAAEFDASPAALFARALVLTRDDQGGRALDLLDGVARRAGEFDDLLLERGLRLHRLGRTEAAIADFARLARRRPDHHPAALNLGIALGSAGRYDEAARSLGAAVALRPDHGRSRYHLILSLLAAGRADQAGSEWRSLAALDAPLAADLSSLMRNASPPEPPVR